MDRPPDPALVFGYWLRHRSRRMACAEDEMCARALPNRLVTTGFVISGLLIVAALAVDLLAPFLV